MMVLRMLLLLLLSIDPRPHEGIEFLRVRGSSDPSDVGRLPGELAYVVER
jgi:hypothetical protein